MAAAAHDAGGQRESLSPSVVGIAMYSHDGTTQFRVVDGEVVDDVHDRLAHTTLSPAGRIP